MPVNPNDNNLPPGVKYEETTSDLNPGNKKPSKEYIKYITSHFPKPSPCQLYGEGEESEDELTLLTKCIKFDDYNKCSEKNKCEQCKID